MVQQSERDESSAEGIHKEYAHSTDSEDHGFPDHGDIIGPMPVVESALVQRSERDESSAEGTHKEYAHSTDSDDHGFPDHGDITVPMPVEESQESRLLRHQRDVMRRNFGVTSDTEADHLSDSGSDRGLLDEVSDDDIDGSDFDLQSDLQTCQHGESMCRSQRSVTEPVLSKKDMTSTLSQEVHNR